MAESSHFLSSSLRSEKRTSIPRIRSVPSFLLPAPAERLKVIFWAVKSRFIILIDVASSPGLKLSVAQPIEII